MNIRLIAIAATLAAAAACASAGGAAGRARCALTQRDSIYLDRGPVYRDCAVDEKARLITKDVHVDVPQTAPTSATGCTAAEVEFVVDTAGVPEPGTTRLRSATTEAFGEAVVSLVPRLRYEPARLGGAHVRQIVSERRSISFVKFVVPAGTSPTRPSSQRPPSC